MTTADHAARNAEQVRVLQQELLGSGFRPARWCAACHAPYPAEHTTCPKCDHPAPLRRATDRPAPWTAGDEWEHLEVEARFGASTCPDEVRALQTQRLSRRTRLEANGQRVVHVREGGQITAVRVVPDVLIGWEAA